MNKKLANKEIVRNYLLLLIPLVLFSCYKNGYILYSKNLVTLLYVFKPLIMFVSAIIGAFLIELIWANIKKESIVKTFPNSYLPLYAALFSLVVPVNIKPLLFIILLVIVLIISKLEVIKVNPVVVGRILFVIITSIMGKYTYLNVYEENVLVSYDLWDIILGKSVGGSGATSIFLIAIIFFFLINKNYYKKEIAISSFLSFLGLNIILILFTNFNKINILVDSEIVFASVLIAPLITKSPYTKIGKISYGLVIGVLGFIFCNLFSLKEGVYLVILVASIFVKHFDLLEAKVLTKEVKK